VRWITGASIPVDGGSKLGRATAQALANAGARVIVHYGRAAAEADALVTEIRAAGGRADALTADLAAADLTGEEAIDLNNEVVVILIPRTVIGVGIQN
jgi:NAD(P)-dependent dehydrogenase (short-subunit alcohol dehydrogenase family)